ncbi:nucleotidyltransferase domain-containing protein [Candidatus Pacearchaeota archaeon]|nr:nucleotidyltransferase domain-containing protein [Candidatus Pacearchaeota archaeon]
MLSSNKNKVLEVFFKKPTEAFHVRELARLTNLNPNTIINLIKELSNEDLITKERKKHIVEVAAKINEKFKREKRIYNLKSICNSGVIDLLIKELSPKSISVVGSYSFGEDIENSDIDLVAISENDKQIDLSKFEKVLSRKIHLIVTNYNSISKEFYINLINGIILHGYLDKK